MSDPDRHLDPPAEKECHVCGVPIDAGAQECPFCGTDFADPREDEPQDFDEWRDREGR